MTTNFSFSRVSQLIRRQWVENSRLYVFSTLALIGLLSLVFVLWIINDNFYREDIPYFIYLIGLYISGSIFASFSFHMLGDKTKGTYWLSLPASHLEKLISVVFYSTILFVVIYTASFFLVKSVAMSYIESLVANEPNKYKLHRINFRGEFGDVFWVFIYGFFAVQAFFLLGSIYFSRYSFVITTIVGAVLLLFFGYYIIELLNGFFDKNRFSWGGTYLKEFNDDWTTYRLYTISPVVNAVVIFLLKFVWAPVFWYVAWLRLKEKQV